MTSAIEPFGIDAALDQHSRKLLYRAFASTYGEPQSGSEDFQISPTQSDEGQKSFDLWRTGTSPEVSQPAQVTGQQEIVTVYLSEVVLNAMGRVFADFVDPEADPEGLNSAWQTWRPTYRDHAFMIHELATLHEGRADETGTPLRPPPAIFFDFIFLETGGTRAEREHFSAFISQIADVTRYDRWKSQPEGRCETSLQKVACIKEAGGIPLVFARSVEIEPLFEGDTPSPAQIEINRVAILAPVRFLTEEGLYPTFTSSLAPAERAEYEARYGTPAGAYPTPAVVLYLSWCIDNPGRCRMIDPDPSEPDRSFAMAQRLEQRLAPATRSATEGESLALVWGSNVPRYFADVETFVTGKTPSLVPLPLLADVSGGQVDQAGTSAETGAAQGAPGLTCFIDPDPFILLGRLLFNRAAGSELQSHQALSQPCPFHLEIPFYSIGEGSVSDPMARAVFSGRIMIVGARFRNSADWVQSPAHGLLAGMHQHAMALDNLLTFQDRYLRGPNGARVLEFGLGRIDMSDLYETAVTFLVVLIGVIGQFTMNRSLIAKADRLEHGTEMVRRPSHWALYLMTFATIFLIVAGALYFQVYVLRMAPLNWIGLLAVAWSFFVFLLRDEIADDFARLMRKAPVLNLAGNPTLNTWAKIMRYLDMETIGFERTQTPQSANAEKQRIVEKLYPATPPEEPAGAERLNPRGGQP